MEKIALIVEDNQACSDLLELLLLDIPDLGVRVVTTARQALKALAGGQQFAALITDVQLPDGDGLALVESIRLLPAHANLPVIVLTSSRDPVVFDRARRIGVDACFNKPYSPAEVRNTVHRLVQPH